jgi:hypothetical protein
MQRVSAIMPWLVLNSLVFAISAEDFRDLSFEALEGLAASLKLE